MKRERVDSSNLASVGYDEATSVLEIEFNHGGIYQYFDVPQQTYEELMGAESHGKYFSRHIKNVYEFGKVK